MPWSKCSVRDERIRFVIRPKDGESMASLCREFGILKKTGYKIFERYEEWVNAARRARLAQRTPPKTPRRARL